MLIKLKMVPRKAVALCTNTIALALAWRADDPELRELTDTAKTNVFNSDAGGFRMRRDWVDDERGRLDDVEEYLALAPAAQRDFVWAPRTRAERDAQREAYRQQRLQDGARARARHAGR